MESDVRCLYRRVADRRRRSVWRRPRHRATLPGDGDIAATAKIALESGAFNEVDG